MRILTKICFVTMLPLATACAEGESDHLAEARAALAENRINEARIHAANALRDAPDDATARLVHVRTMLEAGDGAAAMNSLKQIPADKLAEGDRLVLEGRALLAQDRPRDAIALFDGKSLTKEQRHVVAKAHAQLDTLWDNRYLLEDGLGEDPEDPELITLLGEMALSHGEVERAAYAANRGLKSHKDHFGILLLSGRVAIAEKDLQGARVHYARAAKLYPDNPLPLANVIGLDLDLGQKERASELLKDALRHHPNHNFLTFQQARLALMEGELVTARNALHLVKDMMPDFAPGYFLSGRVAVAEGRTEFAISELGLALAIDPENREAQRLMAKLRS